MKNIHLTPAGSATCDGGGVQDKTVQIFGQEKGGNLNWRMRRRSRRNYLLIYDAHPFSPQICILVSALCW